MASKKRPEIPPKRPIPTVDHKTSREIAEGYYGHEHLFNKFGVCIGCEVKQ